MSKLVAFVFVFPKFKKSHALRRGRPLSPVPFQVAKQVQVALATRNFRVYTATDVIGAELCGALKNVLAIACGASDGFGFGANARAALITRGWRWRLDEIGELWCS